MPPWLVILLGLMFLYVVRGVLPPFFIAGMLVYILVPAVEAKRYLDEALPRP